MTLIYDADAWYTRGFVNLKTGQPNGPVADYDAALRINPGRRRSSPGSSSVGLHHTSLARPATILTRIKELLREATIYVRTFHEKTEESGMKLFTVRVAAMFAAVILICMPIRASYAENDPAWCANSGYDNGPARERGPGNGPYWSGEPTDCRSIWRRGYYRGTDPDPNIRLQIMRWKAPRHHYKGH
jgi:hypothetical protein